MHDADINASLTNTWIFLYSIPKTNQVNSQTQAQTSHVLRPRRMLEQNSTRSHTRHHTSPYPSEPHH